MNSPKSQTSFLVVMLSVGLLVSISATIFLLSKQSKEKASLEHLTDANHALRTQIESKERVVLELQGTVKQLQERPVPVPKALPDHGLEMRGRFNEASMVQTQTLQLLRAVAEKLDVAETPELQLKKMRVGIAMLEDNLRVSEKAIPDLKEKASSLLTALKVPDEVAILYPEQAIRMQSLKQYWPYFEAKRDYENREAVSDKVNMRLIMERTNLDMYERMHPPQINIPSPSSVAR